MYNCSYCANCWVLFSKGSFSKFLHLKFYSMQTFKDRLELQKYRNTQKTTKVMIIYCIQNSK